MLQETETIMYQKKSSFRGHMVIITHESNPECTLPWIVHYCGADYHFRNPYGALCYAYGRRFINRYEVDALEAKLLKDVSDAKAEGISSKAAGSSWSCAEC